MSDFTEFPEPARAALTRVVADPTRALLMFDFDGTLAAIQQDPEAVVAMPGVTDALVRLAEAGAQIGVVTGRPATFPAEVGGLAAVPGLVVFGRHGVETWEAGALHSPQPPPEVDLARRELSALVARSPEGTHLEDKGYSVAVHTRRCADPEAALSALEPEVEAMADRLGLEIMPGRFVRELRPPGDDKGDAVIALARRFEPDVVLFAGDDLGDVPAFHAVARMRAAGRAPSAAGVEAGLAIAVAAPELPEVGEQADIVLAEPAALRDLLEQLAEAATASAPQE